MSRHNEDSVLGTVTSSGFISSICSDSNATFFHLPMMRMKMLNSCPLHWRRTCPPDRWGSWWRGTHGLYWKPPICQSLCNTPWCAPDGRPPETQPARRWRSPRPHTSPSRRATASETPSSTRYCRSRSTPPSPDRLREAPPLQITRNSVLTFNDLEWLQRGHVIFFYHFLRNKCTGTRFFHNKI